MNELGPIQLELVNDDIASFYRFFYRKNYNNNETYTIRLDNIEMNLLNLHTKTFSTINGLTNYLSTITNNTTNVSQSNITYVCNEIDKFKNDDNFSCVEIILPMKDGNDYTQNDIDEIYNAAVKTLGL